MGLMLTPVQQAALRAQFARAEETIQHYEDMDLLGYNTYMDVTIGPAATCTLQSMYTFP